MPTQRQRVRSAWRFTAALIMRNTPTARTEGPEGAVIAPDAGGRHPVHVEGEEISQDPGSLERLFRAARSPHIRERHAGGQSPSWFPASQQVQHAAGRVRRHPEAVAWLVRALKDEQRKWFAAEVIAALGTPEPFLEEMLTAAIDEPNPSFNRRFRDRRSGSGRTGCVTRRFSCERSCGRGRWMLAAACCCG